METYRELLYHTQNSATTCEHRDGSFAHVFYIAFGSSTIIEFAIAFVYNNNGVEKSAREPSPC